MKRQLQVGKIRLCEERRKPEPEQDGWSPSGAYMSRNGEKQARIFSQDDDYYLSQ